MTTEELLKIQDLRERVLKYVTDNPFATYIAAQINNYRMFLDTNVYYSEEDIQHAKQMMNAVVDVWIMQVTAGEFVCFLAKKDFIHAAGHADIINLFMMNFYVHYIGSIEYNCGDLSLLTKNIL